MFESTLADQALLALALVDALSDQLLLLNHRQARLFAWFHESNWALRSLHYSWDFIWIFIIRSTLPWIFASPWLLDQVVLSSTLLLFMKRDHARWSIQSLSSHLADFLSTIIRIDLTFFKTFTWSIRNLRKLCLICALSSWLIISAVNSGLVLTYYTLFRFFASEKLCLASWIPKDSMILFKVFRVVIIDRCKPLLLFSIDFREVDIIFLEFFWASSGWLFTWRIRSLLLNFDRFVSCITTSSWHVFKSHLGPRNCLVILMLSISSFW